MDASAISRVLSPAGDAVTLRVKVVPGASRNKIMGVLGERLKVTVAAPPEAGKANRAVCELLAEVFAVPVRDVVVIAGATQPGKTIQIMGVSLCAASETLTKHFAK